MVENMSRQKDAALGYLLLRDCFAMRPYHFYAHVDISAESCRVCKAEV